MHEQDVQTQCLKVSSKRDKKKATLENLFRGQLLSFTDLIDCIWEVLSGKYFGKSLQAGLYCRACDLQNKVPDLPHPSHSESPHLAQDKGSIPPKPWSAPCAWAKQALLCISQGELQRELSALNLICS